MKKFFLFLVIAAIFFIPYLKALPGEGGGWETYDFNCYYYCPDDGPIHLVVEECYSSWFTHCWRQICPKSSVMC